MKKRLDFLAHNVVYSDRTKDSKHTVDAWSVPDEIEDRNYLQKFKSLKDDEYFITQIYSGGKPTQEHATEYLTLTAELAMQTS